MGCTAEKQIEVYLVKQVRALGGKAYKFVSPGTDGVPDRMVCLPGGHIFFAETKTPGEKPNSQQRARHRELRKMGFVVFGCVDSKLNVDIALALAMNQRYVTPKDIEELEMQNVE